MQEENLAELWSVSLQFIYSDDYAKNLVNFLHSHNVHTVLDCSCGVGFPAIELAKSGFDVTATDKSEMMMAALKENLSKEKIAMPHFVVDWQNLPTLGKEFDSVLCRGNSLIYVDSWHVGSEFDASHSLAHVKKALQGMYEVLKIGGFLYIDLPSQSEYDAGPVISESLGEKNIGGNIVSLTWNVTHDWDKRIRQVHSERKLNGKIYTHDYYSFLLKHDELAQMLQKIGFKNVQKIKLAGENNYDIFLAQK